jgi:hypothetical protein
MLNTLGIIATGALMMFNASGIENTDIDQPTQEATIIEATQYAEEIKEVISYAVTVDATEAELEVIKAAAEAAGMGFNYKVRGVSKKKLVIDMVIEYDDTYTLDRVTVTETDGVQYIQWTADEKGQAITFIDEETGEPLTLR